MYLPTFSTIRCPFSKLVALSAQMIQMEPPNMQDLGWKYLYDTVFGARWGISFESKVSDAAVGRSPTIRHDEHGQSMDNERRHVV